MNNITQSASTHAVTRCQQRGIKSQIIELVLKEADLIKACKRGASSMLISKRRLRHLVRNGACSPSLAEKAKGVVLIDSGETIITAFHKRKHRMN